MSKKKKEKSQDNQQTIIDNQQLTSKLSWLPKKAFELEFSLPWDKIEEKYQQILKQKAEQIEIKGFRKGKAPLNLVEKKVNKQKIYQQVLEKLLPETYQKAVKKHNLQPIMHPRIQPIKTPQGKKWHFKVVSCEAPEIKLGDYQKEVKGALAKEKIWTPDKGTEDKDKDKEDKSKENYDKKIKMASRALLENVEVEIADILIEEEVNKMVSRLFDQLKQLGLTVEQYLSSKNLNKQKLREKYRQQAEQTLKLEFILQAIIRDRKIQVKKEEIDKMIDSTPDKKIQKKLDTPAQRLYISSILAKRKVLDYLLSL